MEHFKPSQIPLPKGSQEASEPRPPPDSPFLDEALFADMQVETAEAWATRRVGYQLESPFQYAFEPERGSFLEAEVEECEEAYYDEELDEDELPTLPLPGERFELEIINKTDSREYLGNTLAVPYRWICSLECYVENPKWGQHGEPKWLLARKATGLLIGPSSVLTVAHNLWFKNAKGEWQSFKRIVVTPGRDGRDEPFGSVEADDWRTPKKWRPSGNPDSWDFAVIHLKEAIGNKTFKALRGKRLGWWGRYGTSTKPLKPTWLTERKRRVFSAGYPLDRCGQRHLKNEREIARCAKDDPDLWASTQWRARGTVEFVDSPPGFLLHTVDTTEGQSGAPVWYYYYNKKRGQPRRWLVGLHTGGSEFNLPDGGRRQLNHAVWIRREVLNTIAALEAQLEEELAAGEEFEDEQDDFE